MGFPCIFSLLFNRYTLAILSVVLLLKFWLKLTTGRCKSRRQLHGKTVIVTGANSGIGKETARDLARRGARVILACRDMDRGKEAQDDIIRSTGNKNIVIYKVDVSSLNSVREFVKTVKKFEDRLDILINNAGASGVPYKKTADGLNLLMQINHFGPFLLTVLLLDLLKKSAPSRIIMVSSILHAQAILDLDDLNYEKSYSIATAYNDSKLANILVANELARKLQGTGVMVNSLHPGVVFSNIWRRFPVSLLKIFFGFFFKTNEEGAQTSIYLAVSEEVEGVTGKYFSDCKMVKPSKRAKDEGLAKRLWEKSEELVQLQASERLYL
ncbi:retinol dehydrogenase 12-like [Anabrus simplex]|uniref:retinol dehydrogenase 12-like n=1 Tax=Anabrus simplex TaxID=316456 RepID=UPI0035A36AAC